KYGRGSLLLPIRTARYSGTINVCSAATLSMLLTTPGAPARSTRTLEITTTAATINGHFRIPCNADGLDMCAISAGLNGVRLLIAYAFRVVTSRPNASENSEI